MKKISIKTLMAIVVSLTSLSLSATNFTQQNVEKSQAIIAKTLEAYGGADNIRQLNQVVVDYDVLNVQGGQSRKPEPPWDTSTAKRTTGFDFANQITFTEGSSENAGARNHNKTLALEDKLVNVNYVLKTKTENPEPDFNVQAGPSLRSNGTLLAKRLQQFAGSARHMGEMQFKGAKHDLISFTMPGGPAITLYIDQKTSLINKSERVVGNFLVEYYFEDHKKVDGVLFPMKNSYTVDGDPAQTFTAKSYVLNKPLDEYLSIPGKFQLLDPPLPRDMKTHNLGDNVYWVTQNFQNSLFVEFKDYVIMVGGLAGVTQRIEEFRKSVPDKPIKHIVMTHHHSDHIGGSQEAFDAGMSFIAAEQHENVIREALAEEDRKSAKFEFVKDKRLFSDDSQRLEIIDMGPTDHTEHFLLAYLPEQGVIFEADHMQIPDSGPVPYRTDNSAAIVETIQKHKMKVKHIASAHAARTATLDELMKSYKKTF